MNRSTGQKRSFKTSQKIFYENIIESIPDGIAVIDKNLVIKVFNPSMEELIGFSSGKVLEKSFEIPFRDNPFLKELVIKVLKSGKIYTAFDHRLKKKERTFISVEVSVSPLVDLKGETQGAILIIRDLSRIKKLEEILRRNEKLSSLTTLSASMAHEIKNPLVGIRGAAQLLKEESKIEILKNIPMLL